MARTDFRIFVVDDIRSMRQLFEAAFADDYPVESFDTAQACLDRLEQSPPPGLLLLDVDLPDIDGFSLCRRIRENPALKDVPVIFISALDDLDSRLEGYDAGGSDYIVKPCDIAEVRSKLAAVRRVCEEKRQLRSRLSESEMLGSMVLSNLDEYALLIGFLRRINDCGEPRVLADELLALAEAYRLQAAVQLRDADDETTISRNGTNHPLEVSVIKHVRNIGRIFDFKARSVYNFDNVTLLINDMPLDDPERCGRLRDHLAIAAECVQAKLLALRDRNENRQNQHGMADVLDGLRGALADFERRHARARSHGSSLTLEMVTELTSAFAFLGMTEEQERKIIDIVSGKAEALAAVYDFSGEIEHTLNGLAGRLATHLRPAREAAAEPARPPAPEPQPTGSVELF